MIHNQLLMIIQVIFGFKLGKLLLGELEDPLTYKV